MLGLDALLNLVGPKIGIAGVGMASWFMPFGTSASASIVQTIGPRQTFLIAISFGLLATTIMYGAMAAATIGNVVSAAGIWVTKQAFGSATSTPKISEKTVQEVAKNTGVEVLSEVFEVTKKTVVNTITEGATNVMKSVTQPAQPKKAAQLKQAKQTVQPNQAAQPPSVAAGWANQFVEAVTTTTTQEVISKTASTGGRLAEEFLKGEAKQGVAEQEAKENAEKERQAALKVVHERDEAERRATELAKKQEVEKQAEQKLALERKFRAKAEQEESLRKTLEEQTQREKAEAQAKAQQKPSLADEFTKETKLDKVTEQVKEQVTSTVRDNLREQIIKVVKNNRNQVLMGGAVLAVAGTAYAYRGEIGAAITGVKEAVKAFFEPAKETELENYAAENNLNELVSEVAAVERAIYNLRSEYEKYAEIPEGAWGFWSGDLKGPAKEALLDFARVGGYVSGLFENTFFTGKGEPTKEQQEEVDNKLMKELEELSKLSDAQVKERATSIVEERVERRIRKLAKKKKKKNPALDKLMEFIGSNMEKQFGLFINACKTTILTNIEPQEVLSKLTNPEEAHKIAQEVVEKLKDRKPVTAPTLETEFWI